MSDILKSINNSNGPELLKMVGLLSLYLCKLQKKSSRTVSKDLEKEGIMLSHTSIETYMKKGRDIFNVLLIPMLEILLEKGYSLQKLPETPEKPENV